MPLLIRIFLCLAALGMTLYQIVADQNTVIAMRREIPVLAKKLHMLEKDNQRLQYEYQKFTNPRHLLALANEPELGHLHFPMQEEVLTLEEPPPLP